MLFLIYQQNSTIGNGHYMRCKSVHDWLEVRHPKTSQLINERQFAYEPRQGNIYVLDFSDSLLCSSLVKQLTAGNLVLTFDYFSNDAQPDLNISVLEQLKEKRTHPGYTGIEYAIIRADLLKEQPQPEKANQIFMYIGGNGYTSMVDRIAEKFGRLNHVIKLVRNENSEPLHALPSNFEVFHNPGNLLSIMNNSFMAITSPGLTTMELLYLHVPSILVPLNDLHVNFTDYFIENDLAICSFSSFTAVDNERIQKVKKKGSAVMDGKGFDRIFNLIKMHYEQKMGCRIAMWEGISSNNT